jgi:hypothetical protein
VRPVLNPVVHELAGALRWVGLRDRLRCPECKRIGTFKPHGTLWDRWVDLDRPVRRWLCKWCGFYVGPEGKLYAFPSATTGAWALPGWTAPDGAFPGEEELPVDKVPSAVVANYYGRSVNPWAG